MANLAHYTLEKPLYGWLLILACLAGGMHGIQNIGRLEDPAFPIKRAYVITTYPGASAAEVEMEVTERMEDALQELAAIDHMTSKSLPGRSEILIELLEHFGADETPQVFDELRRRVLEANMRMPPGVDRSHVEDDFGDVYGILYAVTTPGYSDAEIHDVGRHISTQLKLVPGVAKIDTLGIPYEAVYIEFDGTKLTQLGLSIQDIGQQIGAENQVVDAGSATFDGRRLRIAQPRAVNSVGSLENMKIGTPGSTEMLKLSDIAAIRRSSIETPPELIRYNGEPVFTVSVSVTPGQNVVAVGEQVDLKMNEIFQQLPVGIEYTAIYRQHVVVNAAISNFLKNLGMSVFTVVLALCLFMGWRAGTVVGAVLLLTVLGTIEIMYLMGVELQRISLGALMIAMGMLVDNAIVIAEGMVVGVRQGLTPQQAAGQSVARTQYALLGATVIGILAFAPISLSDDNSGHFLRSLFQVVAVSLLLSWVLAITVVPLLGSYLLKSGNAEPDQALYSAWYFKPYQLLINFGLRRAWLTTAIIIMVTAACLYSMRFVKTSFFPTNNTPLFYVDYRLPEGTDILTTADDIAPLEAQLLELEGIESVSAFVGRGSPRFIATMSPELPNPAYARLIIRVAEVEQMNSLMQQTKDTLTRARPDAEIKISRAEFSPTQGTKIEMRYSGPDEVVLRQLADETLQIFLAHNLIDRGTNWRAQSLELSPGFNDANARVAGITRNDLARSLAYGTNGLTIGLLRDDDKLVPIIARAPDIERADIENIKHKQVWSSSQRRYVPITQVVSDLSLKPANTTIYRRDRIRTITAQGNQPLGHNVNIYFEQLRPAVESIELPPGYSREWGGEFESNKEANEALSDRMPMAFGLMFFITVLMFGALKQPIVIWLTVPMIICGVAIGLIITDLPLTFPSFLGVLSLTGMLIKNCIVLVDEIDKRLEEDSATLETMMSASLSRLRPVMLAALTTVVGMSPLLTDAFFREMAVCIMSGLLFATVLTLVAVPVFYRIALGRRIQAA